MSGWPQSGQPPAGPRRGPTVLIAILAGLAVVAAVVVAGVLVVRDGDGEAAGPGTPVPSFAMAGKYTWTGPSGDSAVSDQARLAWALDDLLGYANLDTGAITALRKSTGEPAWEYRVPEPEDRAGDRVICTASRDLLNDAVAVVYARAGAPQNQDCTGLMLFDLRSGKPRWTVKDRVPGYSPESTRVEVAAGMVMFSGLRRLDAFDAVTGARRWSLDLSKLGADCGSAHVGADPRELVAAVRCSGRDELVTLDPASGRVRTRTALSDEGAIVLSVNPTVTYSTGKGVAQVLSPDRRKVAHTIAAAVDTGTSWPEAPRTIRVWKSYLIAVALTPAPPVTVWDLRTGQRLWSKVVPLGEGPPEADWSSPAIAGVDERGIVCLTREIGVAKDAKHRVVRLDLATGRPTQLTPMLEAPPHDPRSSWLFVDQGRIYGVQYKSTLYSRDAAVGFALG